MSAGDIPAAARLVSSWLSGDPIPVSNNILLPSVSNRNALIDEAIPLFMLKLSTSFCDNSPKRLNGIRCSWALSRIHVNFIPSHSIVVLSVQANMAGALLSSYAVCCFWVLLQPIPSKETAIAPVNKKIPVFMILLCLIMVCFVVVLYKNRKIVYRHKKQGNFFERGRMKKARPRAGEPFVYRVLYGDLHDTSFA